MKYEIAIPYTDNVTQPLYPTFEASVGREKVVLKLEDRLPEILFVTSYPPRECGIATYSQDLIKALDNKFGNSFSLKVCALEASHTSHAYPKEVKYILNTSRFSEYTQLSHAINADAKIKFVLVQHEFGLFQEGKEDAFLQFLYTLTKPIVTVFHTVLPAPNADMRLKVRQISAACASVIVMTQNAAKILHEDYGVAQNKTEVIAHGTHLVPHLDKDVLKEKYGLSGRKVLSTFGLLGPGKGIETTLEALPAIVKNNPDVAFLIIGKTHSGVIKEHGEQYRDSLKAMVQELKLQNHVKFINHYLPLQNLLEYLQLSDIYLFTSKDPNQAVSGTFSYAMSCGCPIISTPIPHANEVLCSNTGIIIDFGNAHQLSEGVNRLLADSSLRASLSANTLQCMAPTVWENSAIAHAQLLQKLAKQTNLEVITSNNPEKISNPKPLPIPEIFPLKYLMPTISMEHIKKMTTDFGMIQFSKINQPDIETGYTLDDNARALVATCMHYELTNDLADLALIRIYVDFIQFCLQSGGDFLNYVDQNKQFTTQNEETNLADSNGRALWALGFVISKQDIFPENFIAAAHEVMQIAAPRAEMMHSTRAMAFAIKGLYYYNLQIKSAATTLLIRTLADRLVQMYRHESDSDWQWYESYLTYGNSILPEAMLCAYLETGDQTYKETAKVSFDFLLSLIFKNDRIKVISNKGWLHRGHESVPIIIGGEQPIDVAYTILAMSKFYKVFRQQEYAQKMEIAFNWFLGNNHLNQIIYNPCTGGCYDGLEETQVNLNQGAESAVSYLMARLTM